MGVVRILKRGGVEFLIEKGKAGVPGEFRGEAPEDIPFPCI